MQPCHKQSRSEASRTRSSDAILNAEAPLEVSIARTLAARSGSGPECKNCPVVREKDELILKLLGFYEGADKRLANLTQRQQEVMTMVLAGHQSKNIAAELHISQRTVENHRASIMKRAGARSLPELARLAFAACWTAPRYAILSAAVGAGSNASGGLLQS